MKHKKLLKFVVTIFLLIFLCSYFIEISGYYEYNLQNRKNLTEEQIQQFEQDVKNGKDIDLDTYLKDERIDYSSKLTRTTSEASIKLNNYLKNFLSNALKVLKKLM